MKDKMNEFIRHAEELQDIIIGHIYVDMMKWEIWQ
jgi:hypothetical protein